MSLVIVHPVPVVGINWQLLINEIRLYGHQVIVTGYAYVGDYDEETMITEPVRLLVTSDIRVVNESPLEAFLITDSVQDAVACKNRRDTYTNVIKYSRVDKIAEQVDEYLDKEVLKLDYDHDKAIGLFKDKHVSVIREMLDTKSRVLVIKGDKASLVMRETGNEYTERPTNLQRLSTLAQATTQIIATKLQRVPIEQTAARLKTCFECDYISQKQDTCLVCGCIVDQKAKYVAQSCPKGYWL